MVIFSRIGIDLFLPKLYDIKPEHMISLKTKPKSFPGILTSLVLGGKRRQSIPFSKGVAIDYLRTIMTSAKQILDTSYLYVGGREKRVVIENDENKVCRTRITLCQEDIPTLISTLLSRALNMGFQLMDKGFNYGGRVNGRLNFKKLSDALIADGITTINFNADFSGHDNNVSEEAIVAAFALLRLCFPESRETDRLFFYVMSGMIFKRIVLPESKIIYQISKGIATGHGMTNIINTLCSYGTFATAVNLTSTKEERDKTCFFMAGDDVIGRMPTSIINKVQYNLKTQSGMKLSDISMTSGLINCTDSSVTCTFLKKKYSQFGISWNDVELCTNLSYPTSTKMPCMQKVDNVTIYATQAPFDFRINMMMRNMIIIYIVESLLYEINKSPLTRRSYNHFRAVWERIRDGTPHHKLINYKQLQHVIHVSEIDGLSLTKIELKRELDRILKEFEEKLRKQWNFMLTERYFKSMETVIRIEVYDLGKILCLPKYDPNASTTFELYKKLINL